MRVFQAATVQPHVDLDGRALPAPTRRLVAIAVDVLLLAVPSLLIALTAAVVAMAVRHPAAFDALRTLIATAPEEGSPEANRLIGELAPFLVQVNAEGVPPAAVAAVEEGDVARAGELLSGIPIRSSSANEPGTG